jgi:hypothetical protein
MSATRKFDRMNVLVDKAKRRASAILPDIRKDQYRHIPVLRTRPGIAGLRTL